MTLGKYVESEVVFAGSVGDPLVPTVGVEVGRPVYQSSAGVRRSMSAPLDTCCGVTVISETLTDELDLTPCDWVECTTYEHPEPVRCDVCALELVLSGSFCDIVRAVVMPIRAQVVIGRDVLNRLRMTLDASQGLVELEPSGVERGP